MYDMTWQELWLQHESLSKSDSAGQPLQLLCWFCTSAFIFKIHYWPIFEIFCTRLSFAGHVGEHCACTNLEQSWLQLRGGGCKVWHQETCSLIKLRGSAVPPVADKSNESSSRKTSLKPRPLFKRTLSASRTSLPGRRGMYFFKKWDRLISQEFLHLVPWSQYYTSHPCPCPLTLHCCHPRCRGERWTLNIRLPNLRQCKWRTWWPNL